MDAAELVVRITGDIDDIERKLDRTVRSASNMGDGFERAGRRIADFGKVAAVGLGAAAAGAVGFAVSAVKGASDLAETMSKSTTIFGDQAGAIDKWASTAATSFGQSKKGALDAAATFGNLFVQLGTGSGEAARMSQQMVELGSDFASFHNADPTAVIESMTAAFRGEYDAVQRYVPTITAAAVEQQALKMGLAGSTKELTAQHKAIATQALLMAGAGDAMGDFARTSDGLANRQRILASRFTDLKDRLGTALLPVVLNVVSAFMDMGTRFAPVIARIGDGIKLLVGSFTGKGADIEGDLAGFMNPIIDMGARLRAMVDSVVGWVRANWPEIKRIITETMETVSAVITGVVTVVRTIWENFGSQIMSVARAAWDYIKSTIQAAMDIIQGIVKVVTGVIQGDWGKVWEGIKQILSGAWDFIVARIEFFLALIKNIISAGWEIVKGIFSGAWDAIKGVAAAGWEALKDGVSSGIGAVIDFVSGLPGKILGALGDLGGMLWDAGWKIMMGLKDGIVAGLGAVKDFVSGIAGKIISWKGPPEYDARLLEPAGMSIMDSLIAGLQAHENRLAAQLAQTSGMIGGIGTSVTLSRSAAPAGGFDYDRMADALVAAMKRGGIGGTNVFPAGTDPMHMAREIAWRTGG